MNVNQYQIPSMTSRKCVKVSPMEKELDSEMLVSKNGTYKEEYKFFVEFSDKTVTEARLYVTSEDNAYGVVLEKWFDGKVEPYILKNQTWHFLGIELNEIHRLSPHCEKQSFYHCLAEKLAEDNTCPDPSCLPITLPSDTRDADYQQCNSTDSELCQDRFWSLFVDEDICKGAKCFVSEYTAFDDLAPQKIHELNGLVFHIFEMGSPISTGGERVGRASPYKTVNTEFYILDAYQLIGQIGGTLGLMIGFSFLGSVVSIMESAIIFASWLRQKSKRHEPATVLTESVVNSKDTRG